MAKFGEKGYCGNRSGKSKIQCEFERKCREYMDETGWTALKDMAGDKKVTVRMWALDKIMDRAFGRAKESLDVTSRDGALSSPSELAVSISELITRAKAGSDGAGQPEQGTA